MAGNEGGTTGVPLAVMPLGHRLIYLKIRRGVRGEEAQWWLISATALLRDGVTEASNTCLSGLSSSGRLVLLVILVLEFVN